MKHISTAESSEWFLLLLKNTVFNYKKPLFNFQKVQCQKSFWHTQKFSTKFWINQYISHIFMEVSLFLLGIFTLKWMFVWGARRTRHFEKVDFDLPLSKLLNIIKAFPNAKDNYNMRGLLVLPLFNNTSLWESKMFLKQRRCVMGEKADSNKCRKGGSYI